jgi:hypothetical protein
MTMAAAKRGISDGFTTCFVLVSFLKAVLDVNVCVVKVKVPTLRSFSTFSSLTSSNFFLLEKKRLS